MSIADEARAEFLNRVTPGMLEDEIKYESELFAEGAEWLASRKPEAAPVKPCSVCGIAPEADTPSSWYQWHDDNCTGEVNEPEAAPSDTDRETLIKLRLATDTRRMSDGYNSVIVRGNEEAADLVLAAGFSRSQPVRVEVTGDIARIIDAELLRLAHGELSLEGTDGEWIAQRLAAAGFSRASQPVQVEVTPSWDALTQEERHEMIAAAVKEMTPNFTNGTAAWNAWNNLNTSPAFLAAIQALHPRKVEVTDDMVTKAYRAQHIAEWGDDLDPNDIGTPNDREAMRAALSAALGGGE